MQLGLRLRLGFLTLLILSATVVIPVGGADKIFPAGIINVASLTQNDRGLHLPPRAEAISPRDLPSPSGAASTIQPSSVGTLSTTKVAQLFGFVGLDQAQSCTCVPPDVQVAAGPSHIVEMVNLEMAVYSKQGLTNKTLALSSFFKTASSDFISDPKVLYDQLSTRWFASILDVTTGSVRAAVSSTSDPTGNWTIYNLASSACPDQPTIGLSNDKFVASANDFTNQCNGGFAGAQYWVLNKSQMLTGSPVSFSSIGPNNGLLSAHPAQSLGSTTTQYLVSLIVNHGSLVTTSVRLLAVTGVPGVSTVSTTTTTLSVSTLGTPPSGVEPGTSSTIDTADFRPQDVVWLNGKLWFGLNDACTPSGDTQNRSCVRLTEVNTSTSPASVAQDFDYGLKANYYYYPSVKFDKTGNLVVVYGYSNSTVYPSIAITGQLVTDPPKTLAPPVIVEQGSAADTSTRFGDYFGSGVDPSDASIVWVSGEYHDPMTGSCGSNGSCWSTFISSATLTGFTLSIAPSSVSLTNGGVAQSSAQVTNLNGFVGNVSVSASFPSASLQAVIVPSMVNSAGDSTITIFASSSTVPGVYDGTVTATSGSMSRSMPLAVNVTQAITFSVGGGGGPVRSS